MQQYKKILGKVMMTAEGTYDSNKEYDPISLITDEETGKSYISRKEVPARTQINNREYWQPVASSGIIDNGVIILNRKNSDGQVPIYDLKSAAEAVAIGDRKGGVILGFLGFNPETDTVPTWKLYQYNDVSPSNWTNIDYWLPMNYTNKYAGWFDNEEALYDSVPFPKVGMYAYVGNSASSAIIYRCYKDRVWQPTEDKAFSGVVNLADEEDITSKQNKLKFKDKEYNPAQYNGLGRIYLRKNMIDGKNILTQDMINKENTIYEIRYDFDLNGAEITILEGCVLDFQGGSFSNGVLNGDFTISTLDVKIFDNINIIGKLFNEYIHVAWFGAISKIDNMIDCTIEIQEAINNAVSANVNKVKLNATYYKVSDTIHIPCKHFSLGAERVDTAFPAWEYDKILAGFVMVKNKPILQLDNPNQIYLNNISFMTDDSFEDISKNNVFGIYSDFETVVDNFGENYFVNLRFYDCTYGIYNRMSGYEGWTLNTFKNLAFIRNKIGLYIHSFYAEGQSERAWMNHNIIDSCAFSFNRIGGILCDVHIIETTEVKNCTFEKNGQNYNLEEYNQYGAFGANINATAGYITFDRCYFEDNWALREGDAGPSEKLFRGSITPSNITRQEGHVITNSVKVKLLGNVIANAFQIVSASGSAGVITKDNEWYFTIIDDKVQKAIVTFWKKHAQGIGVVKMQFEEIYVSTVDALYKWAPENNPPSINESFLVTANIKANVPGFPQIDIEGYNLKEKVKLYINSEEGNNLNTGLLAKDSWETIHNMTDMYGKNLKDVSFSITGEFNDLLDTKWKRGANYVFNGNDCVLTISKFSNGFYKNNLEFNNITFNINAQNSWIVFYFTECDVVFNNCIFNLDCACNNYYDFIRYVKSNVLFDSCTFNKTSSIPVRLIPADEGVVDGSINFRSCTNAEVLYVRTSDNLNTALFKNRNNKLYRSVLFNEDIEQLCTIKNYEICNLDGSLVSKRKIIDIPSHTSIDAIQEQFNYSDVCFKIVRDIDLQGGTLELKTDCVLDFSDNTKFKNGTVNLNYCSITPISSLAERFSNVEGQLKLGTPFKEDDKIIMYGDSSGVKVDLDGNNIVKQGTTEDRPNKFVKKGFQYFDTTLNKPIYWTGTKWVDATGADV